jgi:ABC-type cobalamin/Fe3+-siderophores transport system ATPase subunit
MILKGFFMMLHLTNLTLQRLEGISFTWVKGQNLTVLGVNGAGKTTLAQAIVGLLKSDQVMLNETTIGALQDEERKIHLNYVPSTLAMYDPYFDVRSFLLLSSENDQQGADHALEQFELTHFASQPVVSLSSGESQLLLSASALLRQATFTIFDEPTANLDPLKQRLMVDFLKDSSSLPSKMIITHDLNVAYHLGYDILVLNQGKIIFQGAASRFFEAQHIEAFYQGAIKRVGDHFVVNL